MQRSEVIECIGMVGQLWPHSRRADDADELRLRVEVWGSVLGDLDAAHVRAALLSMNGREFAPTPGQLRGAALELANPDLRIPDAAEAWDEVLAMIQHRGSTRYDRCHHLHWSHPAIGDAVRAMGGYEQLCVSEDPMVDRAHWTRVIYPAVRERHQQATFAPPAVAALRAASAVALEPGQDEP